ncbi:MAG TPA: GNAT family N-acetyltransferase [Candidatus Cloacimonadota bacterium]|nr:GNAT family N-acetyltransferase [Candidatus Cloacimonadota bacterium]
MEQIINVTDYQPGIEAATENSGNGILPFLSDPHPGIEAATESSGNGILPFLSNPHPGIEAAAKYIHNIWGRKENFCFYYDAIVHASLTDTALPRFYLMLEDDVVIGCYALLINDLISRQDLYPWLACLFIEPSHRGKALGSKLLEHGLKEAARIGYKKVFLTTDHDGYYEKYGWTRMEDGYNLFGEKGRIYWHYSGLNKTADQLHDPPNDPLMTVSSSSHQALMGSENDERMI